MLNKDELRNNIEKQKEKEDKNAREWAGLISKWWIFRGNTQIKKAAKEKKNYKEFVFDSSANHYAIINFIEYYKGLGYKVNTRTNYFNEYEITVRWKDYYED